MAYETLRWNIFEWWCLLSTVYFGFFNRHYNWRTEHWVNE